MRSKRLYYENTIPYGSWALSVAILIRAFLWFKAEDAAAVDDTMSSSTAQNTHGDDDGSRSEGCEGGEPWAGEGGVGGGGTGVGAGGRSWGHSSSAYQTDEEARTERFLARQRSDQLRRASYANDAAGDSARSTAGAPSDPDASARAQRAAAAAAYAAAAVRKPHFSHANHASRANIEREAMRKRLHQHVQRELARHSAVASAAALDINGDAI